MDKLDRLPAGMRDGVRMGGIHGTFFLHYNIHCYLVERHYVSRASGCLLDIDVKEYGVFSSESNVT